MTTTILDNYVADQWRKLDLYVNGIKSGAIVSNRWIKLAVQRYEADRKRADLDFKADKVERVFRFFFMININNKNEYKQFEPLPYQVFIVVNLFGFYWKGTEKRRFRYSLIFIARKAGKTVFSAILNLFFLIADEEKDPQSLLLASTREQASIALDYAKSIVINSPILNKKVQLQQYMIRYNNEKSRGFMKTLASNSSRLDGYNPSSAILDEIHAYPDDSLFRVIKSGILARTNPMIMLITTAGFIMDSFCNEIVEMMKNLLKEDIKDDSFFGVLYTLDEEDDYNDPDTWVKANPALGEIISNEAMMIEYEQAINTSSQLPNFLTKHLNIFTQASESFIPDPILRKTFKAFNPEELNGLDMYLGLDLSSTKDLTSLVGIVQHPETELFHVFPYFFRANNPEKRFRKGGIDLSQWIKQGYIQECQTSTIDYNLVIAKIKELTGQFNVVSMAYDQFNSALIVPQVQEMGVDCIRFAQTAMQFNFPLKYIEKQVYDETIVMGDNKVLLWNFRNIVLYADGNGNIKIMKNKSLDAVDGAVSLAMAMGIWIEQNLSPERLGLEIYNLNEQK